MEPAESDDAGPDRVDAGPGERSTAVDITTTATPGPADPVWHTGREHLVPTPMFPLGSVVFPGQLLPLHIFEPRYQQMLQHCLSGEREFGVVLIERGHEVGGGDIRAEVGTVARILDAAEATPGHWAVIALGTRRVRVRRWHRDDPWPSADIEDLGDDDDPGEEDDSASWDAVRQHFRRVRALAAELDGASTDVTAEFDPNPAVGSFHIAALSPLGAFDRQRVLGTAGVQRRLSLLAELLAEAEETLRAELALGDDPGG